MLRGAYTLSDRAFLAVLTPSWLTPIVIAIWLPLLRPRSAAEPRPPMLPTCGGYECEGMWRTKVRYVMGETAGKKPLLLLAIAPGGRRQRRSSRSSLAAAPTAPEVSGRRWPRRLPGWPRVRRKGLTTPKSDVTVGSRLPISDPGKADPGPMAPPPTETPLASAPTVVHWHLSLRVVSTSPLPTSCS